MHFTLCDMVADVAQNAFESRASFVRVTVIQSDTDFTFLIRDNGCGISAGVLDCITDPFYTDGIKHPGRRTGLGIPFLVQTAEATGGSWSIQSVPGQGTEVSGIFPLSHIDTPPAGDVPGLFRILLMMPDMTGMECDVVVSRTVTDSRGIQRQYQFSRQQLQQQLGRFDTVDTLVLLKKYLESQEN